MFKKLLSATLIESDGTYHAKRANHVTSSSLKDFGKNPILYRDKHVRLSHTQEPSEALYKGTLIHTVVLEGPRKALQDYDLDAPKNSQGIEYGFNSQKFKERELELIHTKGIKLARQVDYDEAVKMRSAVMSHGDARTLLMAGEPERVVRGVHQGLPVQIKMDWLCTGGIVDLKTVTDIGRFWNGSKYCDVLKYGYLISAAFYREILHAAMPEIPRQPFRFIAVEKTAPYPVHVWNIDEDYLDHYAKRNVLALKRLKDSIKNNVWEDPYKGTSTIRMQGA